MGAVAPRLHSLRSHAGPTCGAWEAEAESSDSHSSAQGDQSERAEVIRLDKIQIAVRQYYPRGTELSWLNRLGWALRGPAGCEWASLGSDTP